MRRNLSQDFCFGLQGLLLWSLILLSRFSPTAADEQDDGNAFDVGPDLTDPLYDASPASPNTGSVVIEMPPVMCNPQVSLLMTCARASILAMHNEV